jgi:hypothetical protein
MNNFDTYRNPDLLALLYHQSANEIAKEVIDTALGGGNPSGVLEKVYQVIINEGTAVMLQSRKTFLVTAKIKR